MSSSSSSAAARFPLHFAVWQGDQTRLQEALQDEDLELEREDPRGRTALELAVQLGNRDAVKMLLEKGADATRVTRDHWAVSHEAAAWRDVRLLSLMLQHRDFQRDRRLGEALQNVLRHLRSSPDFYVEMKWNFSSWIPFVSRVCPSDTYKIWKRGSSVRIDSTLAGYENGTWLREPRTFLFIHENGRSRFVHIEHAERKAAVYKLTGNDDDDDERNGTTTDQLEDFRPPPNSVHERLSAPLSTTYVDVDRVGFERVKSAGIMSWLGAASSQDKVEKISGHDCKVWNVSNVALVAKTRTDHLTADERKRIAETEQNKAVQSMMRTLRTVNVSLQDETANQGPGPADGPPRAADPRRGLTADEYLDGTRPLPGGNVGLPRRIETKVNSLHGTMWMADTYPLSLQEQIAPLLELLSASAAQWDRLARFVRLHLPAGFPVQIEIPLFHLVSARITFASVNEPGPWVEPIDTIEAAASSASNADQDKLLGSRAVSIEAAAFQIPDGYEVIDADGGLPFSDADNGGGGAGGMAGLQSFGWMAGSGQRNRAGGEGGTLAADLLIAGSAAAQVAPVSQDDIWLQMAIAESMRTAAPGTSSAAAASASAAEDDEDEMLRRALRESLVSAGMPVPPELQEQQRRAVSQEQVPEELVMARILKESKEEEDRRAQEAEREQQELEAAIQRSLQEK